MKKRILVGFFCVALLLMSAISGMASDASDKWPNRTITVICASEAGNDMDHGARLWAKYLSEEYGVDAVVINDNGHGIAARRLLSMPSDGYTILYCKSNLAIEKSVGGMNDISLNDFAYIGTVVKNPASVLGVKPRLKIKDMKELYAYAEEHPYELVFTDSAATNTQLTFMLLEKAGFKITAADMGGTSGKINGFLGDSAQIVCSIYSALKQYEDVGEVVFAATVSDQRNPFYPNIPTLKEQGFDIVVDTVNFWSMHKDTDPDIVKKISAFMEKRTNSEAFKEEVGRAQSQVPFFVGPEGTEKDLKTFYDMLYDVGFGIVPHE